MEIREIEISKIKPYAKNPRKNNQAVEAVANSIKEFGFKVPLVIDSNYEIVAGHTRYKASKKLKLTTVPCIIADDLTEEQIKAFRLADNKVGEIAEWDDDLLSEELLDLDFDMTAFGFDEIKSKEPTEIIEDEVPEVDEDNEPITKLGDVWQLGEHRLMCGDSTSEDDVKKLMNGKLADMVFTDPPYNIAYEGGTKKRQMILNDKVDDFYNFLLKVYTNLYNHTDLGAPIYVTHADSERINFTKAFIDAGFKLSSVIIWAKNNATFGRQDYKWKHEPILYGWNPLGAHHYYGAMNEETVWEIKRPSRSEEHPTMKPLELIVRALNNSSKKNNLILDLFGGSGSTLIACEQLNRKCYMMELEPKYCDVIIKRWETLTGKKAELING